MAISGGAISQVFGGLVTNGDVTNNAVTFSDNASANNVYGGYSYYGRAENNTVTLSDNASADTVYGGRSNSGMAENNTVTLSGGASATTVYGGYSESGTVTANTVWLKDTATVSNELFGGGRYLTTGIVNSDVFTGNTLNFAATPMTVSNLGNFDRYSFTLNDNNTHYIDDDTQRGLLTVTDTMTHTPTITDSTPTATQVSSVRITGMSGELKVQESSQLVLIDASQATISGGANDTFDGLFSAAALTPQENIRYGLIQNATVNYRTEDGRLIASIADIDIVPDEELEQLTALTSQGRNAALMQVSGATDVIANDIFSQIADQPVHTVMPLLVARQSHTRYKTGSHGHDDINDTRLVTGASYRLNEAWTVGAFAEYGHGSYNSYSAFEVGNVHGSGNSHYAGGGLLMKYQHGAVFAEGSVHTGRNTLDYSTGDIVSGGGDPVAYDSKSRYTGGHVTAGYRYQYNDCTEAVSAVKLLHM